jgi:ribosome-associated translation inhibitor RaiA
MTGINSKDVKESDALKKYITDEMKKVAKVAEQGILKYKRSIEL